MAENSKLMNSQALRFGILVPFLVLIVMLGICFWFASRGRTYIIPMRSLGRRDASSSHGERPRLFELWSGGPEGAYTWASIIKPLSAELPHSSSASSPCPSTPQNRKDASATRAVRETHTTSSRRLQVALLIAMPTEREPLPLDKLHHDLSLSERFGGTVDIGIANGPVDESEIYFLTQ